MRADTLSDTVVPLDSKIKWVSIRSLSFLFEKNLYSSTSCAYLRAVLQRIWRLQLLLHLWYA